MSNDFDDMQEPSDEPNFGSGGDMDDDGFHDDAADEAAAGRNDQPSGSSSEGEARGEPENGADPGDSTDRAEASQPRPAGNAPLGIDGPHADFIDVQGEVMPETDFQMVEAALRADAQRASRDPNLVFELGPMAGLTKQFNELIKNLSSHPGVVEALQHHMNSAFHRAAELNSSTLYKEDGTPNNERTAKGLQARQKALLAARQHFEKNIGLLANDLENAGYPAAMIAETVLDNMDARAEQMEQMLGNTRNMTLGDSIVMGIQDKFAKVFSNGDLRGDARKFNNETLGNALTKLKHVSTEIRFNAGKPAWEAGDGRAAQSEAAQLIRDIADITRGRETSINSRTFRTHMDEAMQNITEASSLVADEDFGKRLKEIAQNMAEMVQRVVNTIKAAFSSYDAPRPA